MVGSPDIVNDLQMLTSTAVCETNSNSDGGRAWDLGAGLQETRIPNSL